MFMFDLEFDGLTDELGRVIAHASADRGAWPISFVEGRVERRWFGIEKAYPSVLELAPEDGTGSILAVTAERDADSVDLRHDAIPRLVEAIRILGEYLPGGFVFRATHSGSPIRIDEDVSVDRLATIIAEGQLNEFTRYRVS